MSLRWVYCKQSNRKMNRPEEEESFKSVSDTIGNRMLLWHGSRVSNFVGILSQGLRIAPPEAPSTGYMFGKGIYFADMVSKSANYCCASRHFPVGLLVLAEVATGKMLTLTDSDYYADEQAKNQGCHSTLGRGKTAPDPTGSQKLRDVLVPCGAPKTDTSLASSLLYNEYIVYDPRQVCQRYNFQFLNFLVMCARSSFILKSTKSV